MLTTTTYMEVTGEAIFVFDLFPQESFHEETLNVVCGRLLNVAVESRGNPLNVFHGISMETHQDR
jgi:hypothetical protein